MNGARIDIAEAFRVVGWRAIVEALLHPLLVPLFIILWTDTLRGTKPWITDEPPKW